MLVSFNSWNIIQFTSKTTSIEYFDAVHKLVLDVISENMAYLVQVRKYGAIKSSYQTSIGYYLINYLSETYTLEEYQTADGQANK